MKNNTVLFLLIILISVPLFSEFEENITVVVMTPGKVFAESSSESRPLMNTEIGFTFTALEKSGDWLRVKKRKHIGWINESHIAYRNDPSLTGQFVIKANGTQIADKMSGKNDRKTLKTLKIGDVVTIAEGEKKGMSSTLIEYQGIKGWVDSKKIVRLGPLTQHEKDNQKYYEKFLSGRTKANSVLEKIHKWGEQSKAKKNIVFFFSVILFLLPFLFMSKSVNFLCSFRFISNWIVNVYLIFLWLAYFQYLFPMYFYSPLYKKVIFGLLFQFLAGVWVFREWKKIDYERCPNCKAMFAARDKGTHLLGRTIFKTTRTNKDGYKSTETNVKSSYRDDRQCRYCGYKWSFHRIV